MQNHRVTRARGSLIVAVAAVAMGATSCGRGPGSSPVHGPRARSVSHRATVAPGPNGKLVYTPDEDGNVVPDFSNCGFLGGGVALPRVSVRETLSPAGGDDGGHIQAAIDRVSALPADASGLRGAVLLKKGTFRVAGTISIQASGVVLRGEGEGTDGTVLLATGTTQRSLITVGKPLDWKTVMPADGIRRAITDDYVPVGARTITLDNTSGLAVGSTVVVKRPSTAEWISDIGMDKIPPHPDGREIQQWTPGSKDLFFDRVVTALSGNSVTLDAPITDALESQYGGGEVYAIDLAGRIGGVGIENLRGDSEYLDPEDEDHGWNMIQLEAVVNAWVQRVTSVHFGKSLVDIRRGAKWVTVQDSSFLDPISQITGGRRYSFDIEGGELVLVQRVHAEKARHDFVTGSTVPGPNVFLDSVAVDAYADSGPHHRWAVGTLYDTLRLSAAADAKGSGTGALRVWNRGNLGSGHGWAGANQVFWNVTAEHIRCDVPPTANNWAIGCTTPDQTGDCAYESEGAPVSIGSLYRAQLVQRLGPKALAAIGPTTF